MPLIQSKSKKALSKNIATEMDAHPGASNRAQNLAIAFETQRRNKRKKMADGGSVNETAASERRPMPEERDKDASMVSRNSTKKPLTNSDWTGRPTVTQAQMNNRRKVMPIKHPKMVPSSVINTRLRDEEDDLQSSEAPGSPDEQPSSWMNEEGANRQGPAPHKMKMMAKGGMINKAVSMEDAEEDRVEHPAGLEEDNDMIRPSNDEIMSDHMQMLAQGGEADPEEMTSRPDGGWGAIIVRPSGGGGGKKLMYAEGGIAHEMDEQPAEEAMLDHAASVTAAIMAKRKAAKQASGAEDTDKAIMMAEGGMVDLKLNAMEQPNEYYHENEDVVLKENYDQDMDHADQPMDSNEHGDSREDMEENEHDSSMVSKIRNKMKMRSPITR